jgi:hypothetical protein
MRLPMLLCACLALAACSESSSNEVLDPTSSSSSSGSSSTSTSTDQDNTDPPKTQNDPPPSTQPPTDDPPTTKPPVTTSSQATAADCDSFAATYCAKADTCGAFVTKLVGTDCADRVASVCKAQIAAPGTGMTTASITACGSAYTAAVTCSDAFGAAQLSACATFGSLSLNAQCAFGHQCASGYCTGTPKNECGICATAPPMATTTFVGVGESCVLGGAGPHCNSNFGLWCDTATKTCEEIPIVGLGESCGYVGGDIVVCGPGGTCKSSTGGGGTCVAQKALGAVCTAASGYEECTYGAACISGTCAYPTAAAICK